MLWWLLALAWAEPTEVMLLWPDVTATVKVGSHTSGLPTTMKLEPGDHKAFITAKDGREQIKLFTVGEVSENTQVIDLATMPAAAVPGGTFTFSRAGAEGRPFTVDGIDAGVLPATVVLSSGPHVVVVTMADGTEQRFELTLKAAGDETPVVLK